MLKRILSTSIVVLIITSIFLYNWLLEARLTIHNLPYIEKLNMEEWVRHRELSMPQIKTISQQTGLNREVVEKLLKNGRSKELLELQAAYFAPIHVISVPSSPLTVSEYVVDEAGAYTSATKLVDLRKGDILITKNSRFLGWRNGHAGLVIDTKNGLVLEALMLGTKTKLCSLKKWEELPSVQVLRFNQTTDNELENICFSWLVAEYAADNLLDVPYHLTAGINRLDDSLSGTQCAHLIWYAYKQFGIDLDSDGGLIVTPADIQNSPYLEVVQSYGY